MKENNLNFNQVFLNTIDSKQLLSFLHLNNISANISEKSLSILLAKASFAFLLISMLSYWFQMSFKSQKLMNNSCASQKNSLPLIPRRGRGSEIPKELIFLKRNPLQIEDLQEINHKSKGITYNKTDRKNLYYFFEKVPFVSMWSANITLALLLFIRWIESGHFPLSNLYESLIFLSWSLTVIHLFLDNLFNKREQILGSETELRTAPILTLGAITSPVALFTNAFATFSLPQEMQKVTVLVPALKSNWLIMHVSVMIISYAALLSGSLLAMAFLVIKFIDDNKVPSIMSTFINYRKSLTQLMDRGLVFIRDKKQPFWGSSVSYSLTQFLQNSSGWRKSYSSGFNKSISSASTSTPHPGKAFLLQEKKSFNSSGYPELEAEGSKPLLLKNLIKENKVLLPQILDNLSYRSISLGFALLTIGILSGAVWANEAWGSYWSWDPKETWAFITWLVFALYLHTRLSKGWVEKESAFVASFGFIVIWFCYLGVNLFGKGLHSYGWFQQ